MGTIRLMTNQNRLIANLRHAFNQQSMLGELLQNARRAGASQIHFTCTDSTFTVSDDGSGIADLQTLIHIAESGWDKDLQERENAFGFGVLSTLYFSEHLSVHSGVQAFSAPTADIIRGGAIQVHAEHARSGTEIRLDGVQSPVAGVDLPTWVDQQLQRLCEAFPVEVFLNGKALSRPLADMTLPWRETPVGRMLIDLSASRRQWRCFLQGLPIGSIPSTSRYQIVLLRDDMIARPPDRQHLLNEQEDHRHIQAEINAAYRQALMEAKERLSASDFVEQYADTCLESSNADLLNDVPLAPRKWFRNWEDEPAGYRRFWERHPLSGLVTKEALQDKGVWSIEDNQDGDDLAGQVYLEARAAFLLEEPRLHSGHWLMSLLKTLDPDSLVVSHGIAHDEEPDSSLVDWICLSLVEGLRIRLDGEEGDYAVDAVRLRNTLYLTLNAGSVTRLVSDYINEDDRYDESREDEDAQTIRDFIAVGTSDSPAKVVEILLSQSLRFAAQPKLAGATVHLVFDGDGRLQSVTD